MKRNLSRKALKRYAKSARNMLFPLGTIRIDGLTYRFFRNESPPHNPEEFSRNGLEFHDRIGRLTGETALDIGANIGSYTLPLARKFRTVWAFEPSGAHCGVLRKNAKLNGLTNIRVDQVALSDVSGTSPLFLRRGGATSLEASHYGLPFARTTLVKTARLDDYRDQLKGLELVKIDAEGAEIRILKGGVQTISSFRPNIAMEVHQAIVHYQSSSCNCECCSRIRGLGYNVVVAGFLRASGDVHWVWASPAEKCVKG